MRNELNENLKIIVLLRDPVDRAISHYNMSVTRREEVLPLWRALLAESKRLKTDQAPLEKDSATRNHSYRSRGYYSFQLRELYRYFNPQQVLLIPMTQLLNSHEQTIESTFSFLGVDTSFKVPKELVFSMTVCVTCSRGFY